MKIVATNVIAIELPYSNRMQYRSLVLIKKLAALKEFSKVLPSFNSCTSCIVISMHEPDIVENLVTAPPCRLDWNMAKHIEK